MPEELTHPHRFLFGLLLSVFVACAAPPERPQVASAAPLADVPTTPAEPRLWDETPGERGIVAYFAGPLAKCRGGDAVACRRLSQRLRWVSNDRERVMLAPGLAAACDRNIATACGAYGLQLLGDRGVPTDVGKGMSLLERGCAGGDDISCAQVGEIYANGEHGQTGRRDQGIKLLRDSCVKLGGWPCMTVGLLDARGNSAGLPAAMDHACDTGDAYACYHAGLNYAHGRDGFALDAMRASERYRRACDADYHKACYNLAWLYRRGEGVTKNSAREHELIVHACMLGDAVACDDLAGTEGEADPSAFQKYCDLWGAASCYDANVEIDRTQDEVAENAQLVLANDVRACERGHETACRVLDHLVKDKIRECENSGPPRDFCTFAGFIYEFGMAPPTPSEWVVRPEHVGARASFERACSVGSTVACERLKRFK